MSGVLEQGNEAAQNGDFKKAFEFWNIAAFQGYISAQYNLGIMYADGKGVTKNDEKSFYWFKIAAENGNYLAQHKTGMNYLMGVGTLQNINEAINWFEKSEKQYATSKIRLAEIYCEGKNSIDIDYKKCADYLTSAINSGDKFASVMAPSIWKKYKLSEGNLEQRSTDKNKKRKNNLNLLKELSEKDDPYGQTELGKYYINIENFKEAYELFKKAALQDYPEAQHELGLMYFKGQGVQRSYDIGMDWFKKAAKKDFQVFTSLGSQIVNRNKEEIKRSFDWIKIKATEGNAKAQFGLAMMYEYTLENGNSLKNKQEAFKLYQESAISNYPRAQYVLGTKYYFGGIEVKKDIQKSIKWYKLAIDNGYDSAKKAWHDFELWKYE